MYNIIYKGIYIYIHEAFRGNIYDDAEKLREIVLYSL